MVVLNHELVVVTTNFFYVRITRLLAEEVGTLSSFDSVGTVRWVGLVVGKKDGKIYGK